MAKWRCDTHVMSLSAIRQACLRWFTPYSCSTSRLAKSRTSVKLGSSIASEYPPLIMGSRAPPPHPHRVPAHPPIISGFMAPRKKTIGATWCKINVVESHKPFEQDECAKMTMTMQREVLMSTLRAWLNVKEYDLVPGRRKKPNRRKG